MLNIVRNFQNNLKENVKNDDAHADRVSERIVDKLIDDILVEVVSDIHRAYKMGYIDHISLRNPNDSDENNDVFYPETIIAKTEDINCPKCNKQIHASRFAIHLEKCMPTGRTSSRIASQRLANTSKECSYGNVSDEDDDWKSTPEKSRNVKKFDGKRRKDPVRKTKPYKTDSPKGSRESVGSTNQKEILQSLPKTPKENLTATKSIKEIQEPSADVWISPNKVTPLLSDDKVILFSNKCGVKSDHTGKFCGRSLRCNRHTDAERAEARRLLSAEIPMEGVLDVEDVDHSKSMLGNFSNLNITPLSSNSKKKERQKHSSSKV